METPRLAQLKEEYEKLTDEKERINTLVDIAIEIRSFDAEQASEMADEIISRSKTANYLRGEGRGLNLKGSCYWLQGDYDIGLEVLERAYAISLQIKDKGLEARVLNNFGNIQRDLGDLANALNNFEKALAINEELEDEFAQSVNLTSISNLLYDLNDYDSALDYALRCLPIFERAHDASRLITIYNTLGNIYFKKEQFDEALRYFEANRNQSEEETAAYVMALSGMGKVYYKMQDFEHADKYLSLALDQAQTLGNVEVQIICHYYLGRLYMDEENFRKSLKSLEAAYDLAEEYMRKHDVMSVHETLASLHDKMGNIPKAFHHLKAYEKLKEEIFKQTTFNQLRNLQIRQQTELAQKEKEVAEQTARLKQQFMANMSHEIRTPMNAIVGMTRLLMSKDPKPEQMRYLNAISQSADNLLVIINDILDLSKIEAGKIIIEQTDFSLGEMMQTIHDMLMLKAEEKRLRLSFIVDPDIPQRLIGDPTRINQILINLAGNSVKFTEKGFVEVSAQIQKQEGDNIWIQFDVADSGIGIAPDHVDKIFESFTQAGTDVSRKFGGTGLGLTISKELVNLMHGEISVQSELGKGTTFTVVLPLKIARASEHTEPINTEAKPVKPGAISVLLVEDNEFNRMVAEDTLKELLPEVSIDIAINGQEAVEKVQTKNYDVVLMDIQMPVMDGVAATKAIRKLTAPAKDIKIIAMTANVLQEDVQQYFKAGMNAYVSKPFQADELLQKITDMVNHKEQTTEQPMQQQTPDALQLPAQITDMQFLKGFTGGKQEKMNKYIGMFLDNAPKLLAHIEESLSSGDLPALKIAAHSLKPQLSYMGVKEEVSHIFLIEQTASEAVHAERLVPLVKNLRAVCEQAFSELSLLKI